MRQHNNNPVKPFYLERSDEAVLLIHGFCGLPAKFHFLREFLREETNYSISIPLLSGHGTNLDDLEKSSPKDWINDDLKKHCRSYKTSKRRKKYCVKLYPLIPLGLKSPHRRGLTHPKKRTWSFCTTTCEFAQRKAANRVPEHLPSRDGNCKKFV
jgi:hypothetical protein